MTNLFELIENNDLEGVIKAIENGADVNLQDEYGNTALHWAVEKGNLKIIKYASVTSSFKNEKIKRIR